MARADGTHTSDRTPSTSPGRITPPPPAPPEGSGEKVWPGTYNLGREGACVRQARDEWDLSDPRRPRILGVTTGNGSDDVRFEILKTLGKGAQGYVFKAEERGTRRIVALKAYDKRKLHKEQQGNQLRNPSVWHEFQLLNRVSDIGDVVEVDKYVLETDGYFFVPMEYVNGQDLHHLLFPRTGRPAEPPVDPREVYGMIMDSLSSCHARGVAHRDLKPSNIMINAAEEGRRGRMVMKAKMMDFGLGAEIPTGPDGKPVQMRRPVGTTAWCAPEILNLFGELMKPQERGGAGGLGPGSKAGTTWQEEKGLGYYARPADVWSSGVILWECLTCNPLFHRPEIEPRSQGATENRSVRAWVGFPQSLRSEQQQYVRDIPSEAQDLLAKILVPDPQKRLTAQQIVEHPYLAARKK